LSLRGDKGKQENHMRYRQLRSGEDGGDGWRSRGRAYWCPRY